MSNLFKQMESNVSQYILFVWPLALLLAVIAGVLAIEDYNTSKAGYALIPTAKYDSIYVPLAVAAIPQAGQIVLFFIFGRDTRKRWAMAIMLLLFAVDVSTDVVYKAAGNTALIPVAFIESVAIFTLGSEVMFSLMVGFVLETWPEFFVAVANLMRLILNGIGYILAGALSKDEPIKDKFQR